MDRLLFTMERSTLAAMTIGKQDLVSRVAQRTGMPNKQAEKAINAFMDTVTEAVGHGDEVRLTGFGSFKVTERAARKGRHPRTGEEMEIPAGRRPTFTPGSKMVESVRGEMRGTVRRAA